MQNRRVCYVQYFYFSFQRSINFLLLLFSFQYKKILYTTFNIFIFPNFLLERMRFPLLLFSFQYEKIQNPVYYIQYFYFFQRSIDGSIFFLKEWHSEIPSPLIFVSIQKNTKSSILHSIFLLFVPNFLLERMRFPLLLFSFQYKKILYTRFNISTFRSKDRSILKEWEFPLLLFSIINNSIVHVAR